MRIFIMAALLISMATPAMAQLSSDQLSAFVRLRGATEDCYREHSLRLDDNLSDAKTIGEAISEACAERELDEFKGVVGATDTEARSFRVLKRADAIRNAATVVLEQRALRARARR